MSFEHIQNDTKKKIALILSGIISLLIFIFWIINFFPEMKSAFMKDKEEGVAFFNELEENVANISEGIGNKFEEVKSQVQFIKQHQDNQ